jgi:ribonuclease Z
MTLRRFEVTTLGTGAALPARGRYPTSQLLNIHEGLYLIDCGEGTQERLRSAGVPFNRIGHIFISHLHGDHFFGLVGLISSMHLMGRLNILHVFGPPQLKEVIDLQLKVSGTFLRYPLHFHPIEPKNGALIHEDDRVTVTTLELKHRIECTGFVFRERPALRNLRKETVALIPHFRRKAVQAGEDLQLPDGTMIPNAELTTEPAAARAYAYCSDTAYEPGLIPYLKEVDMLYHEATFTRMLGARAKETAHSTAEQAAMLARDARVGKLLLGHFSSRYRTVDDLLAEAVAIFPDCIVSEDGRCFPVEPHGKR